MVVSGRVAEWSCSGLQIRLRRFDSGLGLQVVVRRSSMVEHSAVNRRAVGSNPTAGAKLFNFTSGITDRLAASTGRTR